MRPPPAPRGGPSPAAPEPMPPDIHNVYIYEVFNTASWSVVLGSPMLLFFQHLNATATILAIAASLAPVLNILQIPAAHFVERVGYRRFVLSGWTTRSVVVIGMMLVAFLPDTVDRATRMVAMLSLCFVYNAMRGISVCGFLPWFTHIVPERRRGEFLAKTRLRLAIGGPESNGEYAGPDQGAKETPQRIDAQHHECRRQHTARDMLPPRAPIPQLNH